jgi:hypothetical protein
MSKRISIVVPDGIPEMFANRAKSKGYTQSAFGRKIILESLKECEHLFAPCKENGEFITNGSYEGAYKAKCVKCGLMP